MDDNRCSVLRDYEKGDFNQRLNLYLQFPVFRSCFLAIDQAEEGRRGPGRNIGLNTVFASVIAVFRSLWR